ncbi:g3026 [Coccomyxa elongata]
MYPRINTDVSGVLHVPPSGNANAYYPTVGMQSAEFSQQGPASGSSNGPAVSGGSPTSQNFPLLRVQIADQYRTLPPVMVSPGLDNIQQSTFSYNFDYERRVEAEATAAATQGSASGNPYQNVSSNQVTASIQVEDPWTSQILKYTEMGFSREEACMALAALGTDSDIDDKFMDFCKNYRELESMGFPKAIIAGALIAHMDDFAAATEACLAAQ